MKSFKLNELNNTNISDLKLIHASNAFLQSYSKSLKSELKETGINVIVSEKERALNFVFKKKIQNLASRFLVDWTKTEI